MFVSFCCYCGCCCLFFIHQTAVLSIFLLFFLYSFPLIAQRASFPHLERGEGIEWQITQHHVIECNTEITKFKQVLDNVFLFFNFLILIVTLFKTNSQLIKHLNCKPVRNELSATTERRARMTNKSGSEKYLPKENGRKNTLGLHCIHEWQGKRQIE